ncbi:uncharacterized protein LOC128983223 [Macrosteles quadrilineatus]|uniref:uncharacterized protein LOC128983223 n=1 Tax=Macrosteles quadrilineatus TaxID=74068 RepID=UPI0023E1FAFA|nr:uncharacterized protein LOC128983223 [Macrosteles quadrilineatus]
MHEPLLTLLFVIPLAMADFPIVKNIPCKPQMWIENHDAHEWECGMESVHGGVNEKEGKEKIADFFIILNNMDPQENAVFCTATIEGAQTELYWLTKSGTDFTHGFVFQYDKQTVRFGIRGKKHQKVLLHGRFQLYGNRVPTRYSISCGAGRNGKSCPANLKFEIRNRKDLG